METLRVTPEQLYACATELANKVAKIEGLISAMDFLIVGTRAYWHGEASDKHYNEYLDYKNALWGENGWRLDGDDLVDDLELIANNYEQVEQELYDISSNLATNVFGG